jgi:hypothetical protein
MTPLSQSVLLTPEDELEQMVKRAVLSIGLRDFEPISAVLGDFEPITPNGHSILGLIEGVERVTMPEDGGEVDEDRFERITDGEVEIESDE